MTAISSIDSGTAGFDWIRQHTDSQIGLYQQAPLRPEKSWTEGSVKSFITAAAAGTTPADQLKLVAQQEMAAPAPSVDPVVERARDDRLTLLAMKYAEGSEPVEHRARTLILTNRLRAMAPAVSHAEWQRAEELAEDIAARSARLDDLEAELGL